MDNDDTADRAFDNLELMLAEVDRRRNDFTKAWDDGATPRLEDFLPASDDRAYEITLLALIGVERSQLRHRGQASPISAWLARFPDAAELIRDHWTAITPRSNQGEISHFDEDASAASLATHGGKIGAYDLLERVGEGRTSLLHRCASKPGEGPSVLRILRKDFLKRLPAEHRSSWTSQWLAAQQALAESRPVGMVQVFETDVAGEHIFARLAWMEGAAIEPGAMPREPLAIARLLKSAAEALQGAHAIGLYHGAIRPSKLLRSGGGIQISGQELIRAYRGLHRLWGSGNRGLRTFIAPELFHSADHPTPQCDIYSLGAILYLLLAGRPPYGDLDGSPTPPEFSTSRPIPLRRLNPQAGRILEQAAHRCLAPAPEERYPNLASLVADLSEAIDRLASGDKKASRAGYFSWLWGR